MSKHNHKSEGDSSKPLGNAGKSYKEFCDNAHILIHSLRLVQGLKPSQAEIKLSHMVVELYAPSCKECKATQERNKAQPTQAQAKSFFTKISDAVEGT